MSINWLSCDKKNEFILAWVVSGSCYRAGINATLKSTGGMTRGRGMDELQRTKYILTPSYSEIKCAFET